MTTGDDGQTGRPHAGRWPCANCGVETSEVQRRISVFCRSCLQDEARQMGLDPKAVLKEFDDKLAQGCVEPRERYQAKEGIETRREELIGRLAADGEWGPWLRSFG